MQVDYFSIPGAPGMYFTCQSQRCTLSTDSCAAQYHRAKGGCSHCTGCELGAAHAGEVVVHGLPERMCCRCGGTDKRIIAGTICISCYNRQRELIVGKNSKGSFPTHAVRIRSADVVVGASHIHIDRVSGVVEAALVALRKSPTECARPVLPPPPFLQLSLFRLYAYDA